jgi:hypothetical protein
MAIRWHFQDFPRVPKDWDFIGEGKNIPGQIEFHKNPVFDFYPDETTIITPNDLYTLKVSHIFWDIKWDKHMFDIQFLKSKGCVLNRELFEKLYAYWNELHGTNKRSDLTLSKEEFFNNALKVYNHDELHELLVDVPMYKKVLADGKDVEVDENKFNKLSHEEKLELVREEVYVMAYERLAGRDYRVAYYWMLKKFIMNHAPMYEALFIIENYKELHKPKINYKNKLDYELSRLKECNLR